MSDKSVYLQRLRLDADAQVRNWRNLLSTFERVQTLYKQFEANLPAHEDLKRLLNSMTLSEIDEGARALRSIVEAHHEFVDSVAATQTFAVITNGGEIIHDIPFSKRRKDREKIAFTSEQGKKAEAPDGFRKSQKSRKGNPVSVEKG